MVTKLVTLRNICQAYLRGCKIFPLIRSIVAIQEEVEIETANNYVLLKFASVYIHLNNMEGWYKKPTKNQKQIQQIKEWSNGADLILNQTSPSPPLY